MSIFLLSKHRISLMVVMLFLTLSAWSQTPGVIYKPAGNALGRSVLDPNGDGYVSATTAGFTTSADYGSASELQMVGLPELANEPAGDLLTGSSGGHTDMVSNGTRQSVYVLKKTINGVAYLIIRFRLGGASTATKGYTLLIDTDGVFGSQYSSNNPGYEKEISLQTGNSGQVAIYDHNASGATLSHSYSLDNYHQRSVAKSTVGGDADYFYDYFVPFADIAASTIVRISATTITSAQSGISGTISDFNGVDDAKYGGNRTALMNATVGGFPPVDLNNIVEGYTFPNAVSLTPVITSAITTASTSISGTSQEASGTTIYLYKNGSATSFATATVNGSNTWTATGISGLAVGDNITAKAQASGKDLSSVSNTVQVTAAQLCYTPVPTGLSRTNGSQVVTGSWAPVSGTISANTVQIRLWQETNNGTAISFSEVTSAAAVYVATNGTWSFTTNVTQSTFNGMTIYATATVNGCQSGYSSVAFKTSGQTGTKTIAPTITTSTILASPTVARSVTVANNDTTAAYLILYINGTEVTRSATTIAAGASTTFSYTGFIEGDLVTARAQGSTASYWLSDVSNTVTVTASAVASTPPVITGSYIAGSGITVKGTSVEAAGSVITLYKAGTTALGTPVTVDAFGNWSVSGLTLAASDVLTAYVKASGKTISAVSNSVTVQASAPTAPTVTGPINAGATSISGTGGLGTVTVYVDGDPVGTTTGSNWTLSGLASNVLYRNAVVTAKNTVSGIDSATSNSVVVQGVASFCITDTNGNPLTTYLAESPFNIKITAMSGANCTGSVFTSFNGTVTLASSNTMTSGGGITGTFVNGVLTTSVAIGGSGTGVSLTAINTNDPTATGSTTVNITAITASVSPNQNICSGSTPANFTLSTNLSTVTKWQKSTSSDFTTGVTDIASTSTTLTGTLVGAVSTTTYIRAVLLTGSNNVWNSSSATISTTSGSVGGSIADSTTVCTGTNSTTLTLSGHTGSVTKWQSSSVSDFSSSVTDINNTTTSLVAANLTATTYYRAVVTNGTCASANSNTATITVNAASAAGTISGATTVCTGTNSSLLTLTGQVGSVQWQSSTTSPTLGFTDINAATSSTYTATNLSATTYYRVVVTSGVCPAATSSAATITVSTPPTGGTVSGSATVCSGTNSTTLTLSGNTGSISKWQSSTDSLFATGVTDIASTSSSIVATNLSTTTYYRAVVVSGACNTNSGRATITINPKPTITLGLIDDIPLGSTSFTIPYSATTGSPNQYSVVAVPAAMPGFTNVTNQAITSTPLVINIPTATQTTTYNFVFNVRNSTTGCVSDDVAFDIMITGVNHGTIGSDQTICSGTAAATLTNVSSATTASGTITYTWEKSTTSINSGYAAIPGASGLTYSPGVLTQTTYFKRVASNGTDSADTDPITITVNPVSVAGTISGATTVCAGTNSTNLTLSGNTGAIQWQQSSNNVDFTDISGQTSATLTATNLSTTTYYRAVVTSGVCAAATSSSAAIVVSAPSVAGTVSGGTTVCSQTNSTTLSLSGQTGSVQWQSSTNNSNFSDISGANGSSLNVSNISNTAYYRAVVTSGVCTSVTSNTATISVDPLSASGTISGATTVCTGTNSTQLSVSGYTGSLQWQSSTNNSNFNNIVGATSATYTATNLTANTYYRVVATSGVCSSSTSTSVGIDVDAATVAGTISGTTTVCTGSNSTQLSLTGATGSNIQWQVSTNNSLFTNISGANATTYTVTDLTAARYYRAVVSNGVCASQNTPAVTMNVDAAPVRGTITGATTVCSGTNSTLLTLDGQFGNVQWQVSTNNNTFIDISGATNTTYTASNLSATRYYRVKVSNGVCPDDTSLPVSIAVNAASNGGSLSGSAIVPVGTNSTTLTLSGYNGDVVKWQSSTSSDFSTNVNDIANTTNTYNATNLTATTYYRAVLQNGVCSAAYSNTATVTVDSNLGGTLSGGATYCSTTNSTTLTLSSYVGTIVKWQSSNTSDFSSNVVDLPTTASTLLATNISTATYYRVVLNYNDYTVYSTTAKIDYNTSVLTIGNIDGLQSLCGISQTTYSVATVVGATNYVWTFPAGLSASTSAGNQVLLNVDPLFQEGTITVKAYNACASTAIKSISVWKKPVILSIAGPTSTCGISTATYSATLSPVDPTAVYTWSVPIGMAITSGAGTSTITVSIDNNVFTNGNINAYAVAECGTSPLKFFGVSSVDAPMTIIGDSQVCGLTVANYSTPSIGGAVSYTWTVPTGMAITSGQGTNAIVTSVDQNVFTSGLVSVVANFGCGTSVPKQILVNKAQRPGNITGPQALCGISEITYDTAGNIVDFISGAAVYSISPVRGATNYTWSVPAGATIISGQGTNSIKVSFDFSRFSSGTVNVTFTNNCGTSLPSVLQIQRSGGFITGYTQLCNIRSNISYSVPSSIGSNFSWSVPSWMTIVSGQGTHNLTVSINGAVCSDAVSVSYLSNCNTTESLSLAVGCSSSSRIVPTTCGTTSTLWANIYATQVSGATAYKFRVSDGITTQYVENATNRMIFNQLPSWRYGTTYTIDVSPLVAGTYIDYGCACQVVLGDLQSPTIIESMCGTTLGSLNQNIFSTLVTGATQYRFEVSDGSTTRVYTSNTNSFSLNLLSGGVSYGTTYSVRVGVYYNNAWSSYGAACNITTPSIPTTKIVSSICGSTLTSVWNTLFANANTLATKYRFEITEGNNVNTIDSNTNSCNLMQLPGGAKYNTTYSIRVAMFIFGTWQDYGLSCNITTPDPVTKLQSAQCGITVASVWSTLYADTVPGATAYSFQVTNGSTVRTFQTANNRFNLMQLAGGAALNTTYSVRVAVVYNGSLQAYGPACSVSTGSARQTAKEDAVISFDAQVFPNPFGVNFGLSIDTSSAADITVSVYDMLGKQIETRQVAPQAMGSLVLGESYAAGVYQVIVSQGAEVKALRVVKR